MSRLKGADLGVSIPATLLNFRGAWQAVINYAVEDLVTRYGTAYAAVSSGAGADPAIPATPATPISVNTTAGSAAWAGLGSSGIRSQAQVFTPSSTVSIDTIALGLAGASVTNWTGTVTIGIAAGAVANGTDLSTVALLASVTGPASSFINAVGVLTDIFFGSPITLTGGQVYTVVVFAATGGDIGHLASAGSPSQTKVGCTSSSLLFGTGIALSTDNGATFPMMFALRNKIGQWLPLSGTSEQVNTVAASGAAVTLPDVGTATMHRVTLTANTTITLPTPAAGKSFTVELVQDATGGRTVAWATPSGAIRWPGGTVPTITATANAVDVVTFICVGGTNWYGFVAGQAFA